MLFIRFLCLVCLCTQPIFATLDRYPGYSYVSTSAVLQINNSQFDEEFTVFPNKEGCQLGSINEDKVVVPAYIFQHEIGSIERTFIPDVLQNIILAYVKRITPGSKEEKKSLKNMLLRAIEEDSLDKVDDIYKSYANIDKMSWSHSLLAYAYEQRCMNKKSTDMGRLLLQYGTGKNIEDNLRSDLLSTAYKDKDLGFLELFLQYKMNNYDDILLTAYQDNNKEIVNLFVRHGANPHWAICKRIMSDCRISIDFLELFLQYKMNNYDDTPLTAYQDSNREIANLFVRHGANLHWAICKRIMSDCRISTRALVEIAGLMGYRCLNTCYEYWRSFCRWG